MNFIYFILLSSLSYSIGYFFDETEITDEDINHYIASQIHEIPVPDSSQSQILLPYLFDSGVGNRERLMVNDISMDENVLFGKGVLSWKEITFGGRQYLVGSQKSRVTLIQIKIKQFTHEKFNTLYFNETFMNFEGSIGPIVLIKHLNFTNGLEEGFALVTESTSKKFQHIHWIKLTKKGLVLYDTWSNPTRGEIIDLKWISHDFSQYLIILTREENGFTTIDISDYKLDGAKMRLMCLDKLRVNYEVSSASAVTQGEDLYMVLVGAAQERVWLYRYHLNFYKAGGFESLLNFYSRSVTQVTPFIQSGQNYFLINGLQPNIYHLNRNGTLTTNLHDCGTVEEWLVLEVPTYREDVVLLARDEDKVSLLTWTGSLQSFTVSPQPPCYSVDSTMSMIDRISDDAVCLALCDWSGAVVLTLGHSPSLILSCNSNNPDAGLHQFGGLYHFNISLHPTFGPAEELAQVISKSQNLQEKVAALSQVFEKEGLLEDIQVSRGRLEQVFDNRWDDLEQCLGQVENQLSHLSRYMDLRRQNDVAVSLSLHHGKLSGSASGLLTNRSVVTNFNGKTRTNPADPSERIFVIDSQVVLDDGRQFSVRANLRLDTLEVSEVSSMDEMKAENSYGISPEIQGPPTSYRMKQDMPLHHKIAQNLHH